MKRPRSAGRKLLYSLLAVFVLLNVVAAIHAYKFTHFNADIHAKTGSPASLSFGEKLQTLFFGIHNSRPQNSAVPEVPYQTVTLSAGGKRMEGWWIPTVQNRGTVILFHGYLSSKSGLLNKAGVFHSAGYNTLLIDFRGSGGSAGNTTSIGYWESEEVVAAYKWVVAKEGRSPFLYGTSMGAAAILKALSENNLAPAGIVLECPFGTMHETVNARFRNMDIPTFPMAPLLLFWGGAESGFWAAGHNPERYAGSVKCPTLLMWGREDANVSAGETRAIYTALRGPKMLKVWEGMGHQDYLRKEPVAWAKLVTYFLGKAPQYNLQK